MKQKKQDDETCKIMDACRHPYRLRHDNNADIVQRSENRPLIYVNPLLSLRDYMYTTHEQVWGYDSETGKNTKEIYNKHSTYTRDDVNRYEVSLFLYELTADGTWEVLRSACAADPRPVVAVGLNISQDRQTIDSYKIVNVK